jgi:hypothetical protein
MIKRKTIARAKRRAPNVMGGKTGTVTFMEIKERPQNNTQAMIARSALYRSVIGLSYPKISSITITGQ